MLESKDTPYSSTHNASRLMGAGTHHSSYDLIPLEGLAFAVAGLTPQSSHQSCRLVDGGC